jgi:hypothetical protein
MAASLHKRGIGHACDPYRYLLRSIRARQRLDTSAPRSCVLEPRVRSCMLCCPLSVKLRSCLRVEVQSLTWPVGMCGALVSASKRKYQASCARRLCKLLKWDSAWTAVALYGACVGGTHVFSAITHIWPDDHYLEKLDHLGIVLTVVGTPISTLVVRFKMLCRLCRFSLSHIHAARTGYCRAHTRSWAVFGKCALVVRVCKCA